MKSALIIGGNGFIGLNLAKRLSSEGWTVDGIDNFATSSPSKDRSCYRNFIEADWMSIEASSYSDEDYSRIYYLASYPSPKSYKLNKRDTLTLGYEGTEKAICLAMTCNATLFLASSSEVYGNTTEVMRESSNYGSVNSFGERSCYDESKRVMETLAYIYKDRCDIRIARIFNTYGPGMAMDGRVFTEFLKSAYTGTDIKIYRDESVTRSPCYISDLLDQIEILMDSYRKEPTNIGNSVEYSLKEIAELCKEICNSSSKIVVDKLGTDKDDPIVRKPVLDCIKMYGYNDRNQVGLKDGLCDLLKYMIEEHLI